MRRTVLVTGATGLIGGAAAEIFASGGMRVVVAARDLEKAAARFAGIGGIEIVEWDLEGGAEMLSGVTGVDWIVHAASPTSGKFFLEHPEHTERMIVEGARSMLEFAAGAGVGSFVFLSSMEVYGSPANDALLSEDAGFCGDIEAPRSSYARGKLRAEALCAEYARQRGVRAMSVRLAQTFGAFVSPSEPRVFAQFLRSALAGEKIRLSSSGSSTRMYIETTDAVEAIRTVLEKGEAGKVYNAANAGTYCSLADMARMVSDRFGGAGVSLGRDDDPANACYPPPHHLRLDVSRLEALGWKPRFSMAECFDRMKCSMLSAKSASRL